MDFDNDGKDDVIVGSIYEDIFLFRGLGGGKFAKRELLRDQHGKPLKGGYCVTTELLDMDADGDLDLMCGQRTEEVRWFKNVGTRKAPKSEAESHALPMAEGERRVSGSNTESADWDRDGKRDLIVGSEWGTVTWYRNVGADNAPKFAAGKMLLGKPGWEELKEGDVPKNHGSRVKIRVYDYDLDGSLDILLGDVKSTTYQARPPLSKKEKRLKKKLEAEAEELGNREFYNKINELHRKYWKAKKAGDDKAAAEFRAAQDKMREPLNTIYAKLRPLETKGYKTHGWVWFYRQMPKGE